MRRLRIQLVSILVAAVLLPLLPAALTVRSLIRKSFDPWLETGIADGARAGLAITREMLEAEKGRVSEAIRTGEAVDTLTAAEIAALDPRERSALDAWARAARPVEPGSQGIVEGRAIPESRESARSRQRAILIPPERMILAGREILLTRAQGSGGEPVWITSEIPADLVTAAAKLSESVRVVETLRRDRGGLIRGLLAAFLAVYGVILLTILLFGLYLASRVTKPIAALGTGIERVAAGDLETQVPEVAGGEARRLIREFNEMTARLRAQQAERARLERIEAWRQMARRLAHEIKNPLTPIRLAAQELRETYTGDDVRYRALLQEATSIIEEEVEGLRALVSEFSHFARLPAPQMDWIRVEEVFSDLGALYGEEQLRVSLQAGAGGAGESDAAAPRILLFADRDQIHRALINLVNNALEAQEAAGRSEPVEIAAAGAGPAHGPTIAILDRGPGVPEAERRRIFEPDVSGKIGGMGLGLAIVEATVRGHGGTIDVGDRAGGGAVFTIRFPFREPVEDGGTR